MKYTCCMMLLVIGLMPLNAGQALLDSGPMLGHADLTEATVWLRTKQPARVTLTYQKKEGGDPVTLDTHTEERGYLVARFQITGIDHGTTFSYSLAINGEQLSFPYQLEFKTQPLWKWRTEPPEVQFMIGSCFYVNDPPNDRPGKGYGNQFNILEVMANQEADFMLWMGDNIYYREPEFNSKAGMLYRNAHDRAYPSLQPLLAKFPHYATWDDHDFGPNDSNRSYHFKHEALNLFKAFWANPHYGMPEAPGVYGLIQFADLDFFLLDNRWYRAPNRLKDPGKPYLGEQQLQWLKDALLSSFAPFKFIVVGNQVTNTFSRHESYYNYPKEWSDLMSWLNEQEVRGVVILSGDRHFSELLKMTRPKNYPLYEFTSSPITSGLINEMGIEQDNPMRVTGTLVRDMQNFGLVKVTGKRRDRTLTMKTIDAEGKQRWEFSISEKDLRRDRGRR